MDNFRITYIAKSLGSEVGFVAVVTKVIHPPLPWKGCLGTPCSLSDFEWSWNANSKHQIVLKNLDLSKQVVVECVESSKFGFKEIPLLLSFLSTSRNDL